MGTVGTNARICVTTSPSSARAVTTRSLGTRVASGSGAAVVVADALAAGAEAVGVGVGFDASGSQPASTNEVTNSASMFGRITGRPYPSFARVNPSATKSYS